MYRSKQLSKPKKKDKFKENLIQIHLNQTAKKNKEKENVFENTRGKQYITHKGT